MGCVVLLILSVLLTQCKKKEDTVSSEKQSTNSTTSVTTPTVTSFTCGQPQYHALMAGQNIVSGSVTVSNDQTNLYVTYATQNGWQIQKTHLYVGDCDLIPTNKSGNPQIGLFPYQTTHNPRATSFTYTFPLTLLTYSCYCVSAHAEVVLVDSNGNVTQTETGWAQGASIGGNSWAMKFSYCTQKCATPTCTINIGDYRTQTQGGWGATPNGNNPGAYLNSNFTTAFPTGLTVGCASGYALHFSSAQAITNFLPQGGTPAGLTQNYTDPTSLNNVLAGQLVALSITLGFDSAIPNFCTSTTSLISLKITTGTFAGWTVGQVYTEANNILGGCSSIYTASQITSALDSINNNFDNGTVVGTYLKCA